VIHLEEQKSMLFNITTLTGSIPYHDFATNGLSQFRHFLIVIPYIRQNTI